MSNIDKSRQYLHYEKGMDHWLFQKFNGIEDRRKMQSFFNSNSFSKIYPKDRSRMQPDSASL